MTETVACLLFDKISTTSWTETQLYMIDYQSLLRIQPGEAYLTSKVCQHNQLPTHHILYCPGTHRRNGAGLCVTLCFSWGIGVWSACDPGPFNILGISNGSTLVCHAPGLNCYLDMICQTVQDETCCNRNRKKPVPSKITQQFICHLPSVCLHFIPVTAVNYHYSLFLLSAGFSRCIIFIQTSRNVLY